MTEWEGEAQAGRITAVDLAEAMKYSFVSIYFHTYALQYCTLYTTELRT